MKVYFVETIDGNFALTDVNAVYDFIGAEVDRLEPDGISFTVYCKEMTQEEIDKIPDSE